MKPIEDLLACAALSVLVALPFAAVNAPTAPVRPNLILATCLVCMTCQAGEATWTGSVRTDWSTGSNWSNSTGPVQADVPTFTLNLGRRA